MTRFGYTMMCEQRRPDRLVRDLQDAEAAGFDFSVISDHYFPWLDAQGHSGYAWSILGAAAQATERIPLMTYVTCPILRYHPAVVAQKAATMQILSDGRFRLGVGAGENLNEHVIGKGWPAVGVRHEMLSKRSTSSVRCSTETWSTTGAVTSTSHRRGSGIGTTGGSRLASRCRARSQRALPAPRPIS
jgi:G6PDH family F420-dependent oxidoreductase